MKLEQTIRMVGGNGDASYAANSKVQENAIGEMKTSLDQAVVDLFTAQYAQLSLITVADLGCSSGPNAFLLLSEVTMSIARICQRLGVSPIPECQFILNDLPANDFNSLFLSLDMLKAKLEENLSLEGLTMEPYYVSGVPGSFYSRLFPAETIHLFTSSYSLQWLSKMPEGLKSEEGVYLNSGNINIGRSSSAVVVKLFQEQFQRDFSNFLKLRSTELINGGHMVLTFVGRNTTDVLPEGMSLIWDLLSDALRSIVAEGLIEKEKLNTFGIPNYAPSREEVKTLIKANGKLKILEMRMFESDLMDCFNESAGDKLVANPVQSGKNVARMMRAVSESLLSAHFGEGIIDDLFEKYTTNVADQLSKERMKLTVMLVALKKI